MSRKIPYIILLILLASCTSELPVTPDPMDQEQEVPVQFYMSINPLENQESRAAIEETQLDVDSHVGIFALEGNINANGDFNTTKDPTNKWSNENIRENFMNAEYVVKDFSIDHGYRKLEPTGTIGTYPSKGALQFYAYYPYSAEDITYENLKSPKLKINIGNSIEDTPDYLYTGAAKSDTLRFKHALGRLNIYIYTSLDIPNMSIEQYPYINNISIKTLKDQNALLNLENGNIESRNSIKNQKKSFKREFSLPDEDEDNSFFITSTTAESAKNIQGPVYSNMFVPSEVVIKDGEVIEQEVFIQLLQITITSSYEDYVYYEENKNVEKDIKNPTKTYDFNSIKIKLKKGEITDLYIQYNPTPKQ